MPPNAIPPFPGTGPNDKPEPKPHERLVTDLIDEYERERPAREAFARKQFERKDKPHERRST